MKTALSAALAALALAAAGADYKSMWITDVISGRTVGPVVNKPGNRFSAGGREWIVLQAGRGEANFADAATLSPQGPYGLVEQRMFNLGDDAYVFTRILDYEGTTPGVSEAVVSQAERAPAEKGRHPWSSDLPERWVLAPLPSTNPGAHKEPAKTWHLETLEVAPSATLWIEPVHNDPHDWSLGGLAGSADADIETRRAGVAGFWRGFFAEAGLVRSAKCSGSLVPDGLSLASLRLDGGDGFHLGAGYRHAIVIDGGWSANVSLWGTYETLDVDLSASTTTETEIAVETAPAETDAAGETEPKTEKGYAFESWKDSGSFDEFRLGVGVGIGYDEWYWGLGATLLVDCWTDASLDASVPVLGSSYKLEAERSRPVGGRLSAWYCPADNWLLEASLTLGSETSLRLGAGLFF